MPIRAGKQAFLRDFSNKKYIYTKYIYSICSIIAENWAVSYGYPMGIVWVSYGADSMVIHK